MKNTTTASWDVSQHHHRNDDGDDDCAQSYAHVLLQEDVAEAERRAAKLRRQAKEAGILSFERRYADVTNLLSRLVELPAGWDGADAEPPSQVAAHSAASIVGAGLSRVAIFPNRTDPSVEGGVVLEYYGKENRYCLFECYNSGEVLFVFSLGTGNPVACEMNFGQAMSAGTWRNIFAFCEGDVDHVDLD